MVRSKRSDDSLVCDDSKESDGDPHNDYLDEKTKREDYLKSMFMCATPEALTPLAAMMYQKFMELCPGYMEEAKIFGDEKVYTLVCMHLHNDYVSISRSCESTMNQLM